MVEKMVLSIAMLVWLHHLEPGRAQEPLGRLIEKVAFLMLQHVLWNT